jgi:hypothetical protein
MKVKPMACSFCGKKNHNVRTCRKYIQHEQLQKEITHWLTEVAKDIIVSTGLHRGVFCQVYKSKEITPTNGVILDIAWRNFSANSLFEFNWKNNNNWFFPHTYYCIKVLNQKTMKPDHFHLTQIEQVRMFLLKKFPEVREQNSLIKLNHTTGVNSKLYSDVINVYQTDNEKSIQEELGRLSDINNIVLSGEYPNNLHHSYNRSYTKFYTLVHQYLKDHFKKTS